MSEFTFTDSLLKEFRSWLCLNVESMSWEGRYESDFNEFWDLLLPPDKTVKFLSQRLDFALSKSRSGPLVTWFGWLKEKFTIFCFLNTGLNLRELAKISETSERSVALVLRDYFIERFPYLEDEINEWFHVGNLTSPNLYLKFEDIAEKSQLHGDIKGASRDDSLTNLEVTLYPDWKEIYQHLKNEKNQSNSSKTNEAKKSSFKKQLKFARELVLLFLVGGLLILTIKAGNKYYEDYLVKKISLFEPNFFWLDKNLSFKNKNPLEEKDVELSYRELENLEKLESQKVFDDDIARTRFEVESDVALTSVESLPQDFTVADLEQSDYEEVRKGGYRDSRYGRRLAYRVMMTSVSPDVTKNKLLEVLEGFEVKQADNVKPGKKIPGGLYFNLYVPRKNLKEFLSRVSKVEESTILESKTVFGGPYGTNKVFIWIKSI